MMRFMIWPALIPALVFSQLAQAQAQCEQVAYDVCVPKKSFNAPPNEQPFFGFVTKTKEMIEADEKFVLEANKIGKDKAFAESILRGFEAFAKGDTPIAARRFNQAFLLEKRDSRVYHGFAMVVLHGFRDPAYAVELFRIAMKLPNPAVPLRADFGRALMIAKQPAEARPLLEAAVKDVPKSAIVWADLAFARIITGDIKGACDASAESLKLSPPKPLVEGMNLMRSKAECK